ncbi:hypothetical protein [Arthrobacter sp. B10-11]|uniref:hypothetical protein n=1 Tax=Arthrobacter sp. B10-11 TaxID=3081160 RepID=UPI00295321A2|nr:hypothetical protein [Arthrobacter sp. B10-11]MDV8147745.1 hypothetical protein [Arthrobacter sp. B10-11]
MAGFYGADIAQLRTLAGTMSKAADSINRQSVQLDRVINADTSWRSIERTVSTGKRWLYAYVHAEGVLPVRLELREASKATLESALGSLVRNA